MSSQVEGAGVRIDPTDLENCRGHDPRLAMAFGDVIATATFEASPGPGEWETEGTRHAAVVERDGTYVLIVEQDGAVCHDLLNSHGVTPNSPDHPFSLRDFSDGTVVSVLDADDVEDGQKGDVFRESMDAQASLLDEMEDQYYRELADDHPDEPPSAWTTVFADGRRILRRFGDVETATFDDLDAYIFEDDRERYRAGIETPHAGVVIGGEDGETFPHWFGTTDIVGSSTVGGLVIEYTYPRASVDDVRDHLGHVAGQLSFLGGRYELTVEV